MNTQTSLTSELEVMGISSETNIVARTVNWSRVAWFLGLAFGLAWLLDLALYLAGGLTSPSTALLLQLQMLLPAFSAILLGAFFFKDSPIFIVPIRVSHAGSFISTSC